MYVKEIWRYPVKSLRGEQVKVSRILKSGLAGDRQIIVLSATANRLITARTHPGLLGLQGSISEDGRILIDGKPWNSEEAISAVCDAAREQVQLLNVKSDVGRFDILPLLVATDGAIADLGLDRRRLRPNIIVGGVEGQAERSWPGQEIRIGAVRITVAQLRMRCVMTTYDPDTLEQDRNVLKHIVAKTGGKTALDCAIKSSGEIHVNDAVELH
jgi:uncharacterized protein YcbX